MTYILADCHEAIKDIENNSISLIYFNPPFAATAKEWDTPLNWDFLFPQMFRILKEDGVIAIHSAIPFTYELISKRKPNYHYTWVKGRATGHLNARKQPLRSCEEILIYYKNNPHTYNPQMKGTDLTISKREKPKGSEYCQHQKAYTTKHIGKYPTTFLGAFKHISQTDTPKSIPDAITNYIMLTYSNEGDNILDLTCCSKNNGDIATRLGRVYIGIDKSYQYLF